MNSGINGWPVIATGAMPRISRVSLSVAGVLGVSAIPQSGSHLMLIWTARGTDASSEQSLGLRLNGDNAANYSYSDETCTGGVAQAASGTGVSPTSIRISIIRPLSAPAGQWDMGVIHIPYYSDPNKGKQGVFQSMRRFGAAQTIIDQGAFGWNSTSPITQIQLLPAVGSCDIGSSMDVYLIP